MIRGRDPHGMYTMNQETTIQPVPLNLQVSLLRAELALQQRETGKRARAAFTAGLITASVLAGIAGVGLGYAIGVRATLLVPTSKRATGREETA